MDDKKEVECIYCNRSFESLVNWEGRPKDEYCSNKCEVDDAEFNDFNKDKFEKFYRGGRSEWQ